MSRPFSVLLSLLLAAPALGQMIPREDDTFHPTTDLPAIDRKGAAREPWPIRPIMVDLKHGILVRLPARDTDPNRGAPVGVMPIWAMKHGRGQDRIPPTHAPSVTYNGIVWLTPTYRY